MTSDRPTDADLTRWEELVERTEEGTRTHPQYWLGWRRRPSPALVAEVRRLSRLEDGVRGMVERERTWQAASDQPEPLTIKTDRAILFGTMLEILDYPKAWRIALDPLNPEDADA